MIQAFHTLSINPSATPAEIKKAYRMLALKHHPDKSNDGSDEMFVRVKAAYDTLTEASDKQQPSASQSQAKASGYPQASAGAPRQPKRTGSTEARTGPYTPKERFGSSKHKASSGSSHRRREPSASRPFESRDPSYTSYARTNSTASSTAPPHRASTSQRSEFTHASRAARDEQRPRPSDQELYARYRSRERSPARYEGSRSNHRRESISRTAEASNRPDFYRSVYEDTPKEMSPRFREDVLPKPRYPAHERRATYQTWGARPEKTSYRHYDNNPLNFPRMASTPAAPPSAYRAPMFEVRTPRYERMSEQLPTVRIPSYETIERAPKTRDQSRRQSETRRPSYATVDRAPTTEERRRYPFSDRRSSSRRPSYDTVNRAPRGDFDRSSRQHTPSRRPSYDTEIRTPPSSAGPMYRRGRGPEPI